MTDDNDATREWVEVLLGPRRRPAEHSPDDPMRQFTNELFRRAQEDE